MPLMMPDMPFDPPTVTAREQLPPSPLEGMTGSPGLDAALRAARTYAVELSELSGPSRLHPDPPLWPWLLCRFARNDHC